MSSPKVSLLSSSPSTNSPKLVGSPARFRASPHDGSSYSYVEDLEHLWDVECAICHQPWLDPVTIAGCGHTFCRSCMDSIQARRCPYCQRLFEPSSARPSSVAMRKTVDRLNVRCRRCSSVMLREAFEQHDATECVRECPNHCGVSVPLVKMAEHLSNCGHATCPGHKYGCSWSGTHKDVSEHENMCGFVVLGPEVERLRRQVAQLKVNANVACSSADSVEDSVLIPSGNCI